MYYNVYLYLVFSLCHLSLSAEFGCAATNDRPIPIDGMPGVSIAQTEEINSSLVL